TWSKRGTGNATAPLTVQALTQSGTLTAAAAVTAQNLTLTGGTLTGAATVTVNGAFTWTNGTMGGTGHTVLNGASTISTGFSGPLNGRTVDNFAAATLTPGVSLSFQGGAVWNNQPGSTFTLTDSASLSQFFSATSQFNNASLVQKIGPSGNATVGVVLNNTGTV